MKKYDNDLEIGLKIIYDGNPIKWASNRTGRANETMNPGKYVITRITSRFVYLKADRKNATTEHQISKEELTNSLHQLDFSDLTTSMGLLNINVFQHKNWIVNDENLISRAKAYNKNR